MPADSYERMRFGRPRRDDPNPAVPSVDDSSKWGGAPRGTPLDEARRLMSARSSAKRATDRALRYPDRVARPEDDNVIARSGHRVTGERGEAVGRIGHVSPLESHMPTPGQALAPSDMLHDMREGSKYRQADRAKPKPGEVRELADGTRVLVLSSRAEHVPADLAGRGNFVDYGDEPGWYYTYRYAVLDGDRTRSADEAYIRADDARSLLDAFDGWTRAADLDEYEDALLWTVNQFERDFIGHFERKYVPRLSGQELIEFNSRHARYPKGHPMAGKFRPMMARLLESLRAWRAMGRGSGRGDDPFAGVATTAQLRRVLKARGVRLPKTKDPDPVKDRKNVVDAFLRDLRGKEGRWRRPKGVDAKTWDNVLRLAAGEKVKLSPEEVPALARAIRQINWKRSKGAPDVTFNFSNLQVTGEGNENAFQRHLRDRPRSTMPQLPTGTTESDKTKSGKSMADWEDYLTSQGVKFEYTEMDPRQLVASQSELSGPKVAKMFGFMDSGWKPGGVMIVARSGGEWAVVDGHHRWAGAVLQSIARGGTFGVRTMTIDADIDDLLGAPGRPGVAMGFADFEGLATDREG